MSGRRLLVLVLVAAACGAICGEVTRGKGSSGPGRPAAVEAVLKAVDGNDGASLSRALEAAGEPSRWPMPWRDEVALGRAVAAGDPEALLAFASGDPKGAPRARAALWLRERAADPVVRDRAQRVLAERYPSSWALGGSRGGAR